MNEDGDLSHYLDTATDIEYPDVEQAQLAEVQHARAPLTLSNPQFDEFWDLSLEEAVSITLHNSKMIRSLSTVRALPASQPASSQLIGSLIGRGLAATSTYDPAIVESDPLSGVEGALAEFDAQFATSIFWEQTDRPQNVIFFNAVTREDTASFQAELSKKSATGTELFFRNVTTYDRGNQGGIFRALPSIYTTAFEVEARQPLMRGRGTQVNRIPVVLARIRNDISLTDFEANVRDLVMDVETAYWDLHCAYRNLEAAKAGRDSALVTWRIVYEKWKQGLDPVQAEAQAREQYFFFRSASETALRDVYTAESALRWLMGLAATDGRLIRPIDEPTTARVEFTWDEIHCEALVRNPEIRRQKWVIQQREMELIAARNQLLPQVNAVALYRWLGLGDGLVGAHRNGLNFPAAGSTAFDELTEGNYQELSLGVEVQMPVGFRRELAGVRQAQLLLVREKAVLEDLELNASHLLAATLRDVDMYYQLAQTNFNRLAASEQEVRSVEALYQGGRATLDLLLDAQRRRAESQIAYYRSLCSYMKEIAQIHRRKGSLLEYDNVYLAEGPWPKKAYWDALGHARRRDASEHMDYGWSRPHVISRGAVDQHSLQFDHEDGVPVEGPAELIPTPQPTPARQRPDAPPQDQQGANDSGDAATFSVLTREREGAGTSASVFDQARIISPLEQFNPFEESAAGKQPGHSPFDIPRSSAAEAGATPGGSATLSDNMLTQGSNASPPRGREFAIRDEGVVRAGGQQAGEPASGTTQLDTESRATTMRVGWQVPVNQLRLPTAGASVVGRDTEPGFTTLRPAAASAAYADSAHEPVSHSSAGEANRPASGWKGTER